jgi:hypothetical protein
LPAALASIPQVPTAIRVTVVPEAEHTVGVVEISVTGNPEEAVATSVTVPVISVVVGIVGSVMACLALLTVKLCETGAAAAT